MKTRSLPLLIAITATLTFSISSQAFAARSSNQQALLETSTISTAAVTGAVAGGPAGFFIGGLMGMYLADQTRKGNKAEIALTQTQQTLTNLNNKLNILDTEIQHKNSTIAVLEQKTIDKLTLQVLFSTGKDALNDHDIARVEVLAEHLRNNKDLVVNLSGHTDPRGTDEYNNVLAMERANSVKNALIEFGIEEERIIAHTYGASFSTSQEGQYEQYARDRRVDIEVINPTKQQPIAIVDEPGSY